MPDTILIREAALRAFNTLVLRGGCLATNRRRVRLPRHRARLLLRVIQGPLHLLAPLLHTPAAFSFALVAALLLLGNRSANLRAALLFA